ncbi:hypothetical protein BCV69DRAFT_211933 [Microstroma glucosiphilum]|uniref:Uncharacterized protein n=1 Tax=Pseudomicrostroma glucosiphilum TaxID=1684307 RepID=A0A316U6S5_9BASI|nr:hypothetical protein BCV69DRAFT_211933 [Pseudomicrostroma glucosiphilum]PWN20518.1 hypothetical protein BCV69DRAFT_211933 [Pseudomicrostroma glucosiphilum]
MMVGSTQNHQSDPGEPLFSLSASLNASGLRSLLSWFPIAQDLMPGPPPPLHPHERPDLLHLLIRSTDSSSGPHMHLSHHVSALRAGLLHALARQIITERDTLAMAVIAHFLPELLADTLSPITIVSAALLRAVLSFSPVFDAVKIFVSGSPAVDAMLTTWLSALTQALFVDLSDNEELRNSDRADQIGHLARIRQRMPSGTGEEEGCRKALARTERVARIHSLCRSHLHDLHQQRDIEGTRATINAAITELRRELAIMPVASVVRDDSAQRQYDFETAELRLLSVMLWLKEVLFTVCALTTSNTSQQAFWRQLVSQPSLMQLLHTPGAYLVEASETLCLYFCNLLEHRTPDSGPLIPMSKVMSIVGAVKVLTEHTAVSQANKAATLRTSLLLRNVASSMMQLSFNEREQLLAFGGAREAGVSSNSTIQALDLPGLCSIFVLGVAERCKQAFPRIPAATSAANTGLSSTNPHCPPAANRSRTSDARLELDLEQFIASLFAAADATVDVG